MSKFIRMLLNKKKHLLSLLLVVLLLVSSNPFVWQVQAAAALTSAKDVISTSQASQPSAHEFHFTPATATAIKTITFQYCTTASGTCTAPTGMVMTSTLQQGTISGINGTGYTNSATDTTCTGTGNTDCTITLTVGSPSGQSLSEVVVPFLSGITNPSTTNTTTFVRITTKDAGAVAIDEASVAFATLTGTSLSVTASVDPTFQFSLSPVTSGSVNSSVINVTSGTSASTIPFGTVAAGTPKIAAHDITVVTNALSGYVVTASASANPPLVYQTSNIDPFTGNNASPATWSAPTGNTASVDTGFFGYTTEDITLTGGTANRFSSNKWAGMTTSADPVASNTQGVLTETTRVGWQVAVNNLQPAGNYSGTVILVATPTY